MLPDPTQIFLFISPFNRLWSAFSFCSHFCMLILQVLESYGKEWIVEIQDITAFVCEQYQHVKLGQLNKLKVAEERVYPVSDETTAQQLGTSDYQQSDDTKESDSERMQ